MYCWYISVLLGKPTSQMNNEWWITEFKWFINKIFIVVKFYNKTFDVYLYYVFNIAQHCYCHSFGKHRTSLPIYNVHRQVNFIDSSTWYYNEMKSGRTVHVLIRRLLSLAVMPYLLCRYQAPVIYFLVSAILTSEHVTVCYCLVVNVCVFRNWYW